MRLTRFRALLLAVTLGMGVSVATCGDDNEGGPPANPCDPDPCQDIAGAVADSCTAVGETDFTCDCGQGLVWNGSTNECVDDPCDPDPCQDIADAVAGSCTPVGDADFTCDCDQGFAWNDATNTCEQGGGGSIENGMADYDARCSGCHKAGAHDTNEGFPGAGDLAGKGNLLVPDLSTISAVMTGLTLDPQQLADMAAFLDSL